MKSPIKILAIVAIVVGCLLLDSEYHLMPWWDEEPVPVQEDSTANTWVSKDTVTWDTTKVDTSIKNESKIIK